MILLNMITEEMGLNRAEWQRRIHVKLFLFDLMTADQPELGLASMFYM